MHRNRTRLAVAGAAALIGAIGVTHLAAASPGAGAPASASAPADDGDVAPLTQQEVDEINQMIDDQAAHLRSRGFEATVTIDTDGLKLLSYDETNEAANAAFDELLFGDEFTEMLDDATAEWNPADIAAANAEADALVAFLASRGVASTVTTDEAGLKQVATGEDQAALDAVDDFYWQQNPMSAEELATMNAEAQTLVDMIIANGGQATAVKDRHGVFNIETDWESPATMKAFEQLGAQAEAANPMDAHAAVS